MIRKEGRADSEAPADNLAQAHDSVSADDMEITELYRIFRECGAVETDSRKIRGGELFYALRGENFDGNEFAVKALEAGAAYAVVSADSRVASDGNPRIIPVTDTLKSLQELARYHRSMTFVCGKPLTVIGLTGTNGKTTTKELVKAVLSVRYNVTATEGNLNNSIGVPLSLLKINSDTQIAVIEMGASHPGDIAELVSVALPNYGLITNVGKAHLQGFGSFEGVMKAKGELYDYIQRTADKVFLNADNPYLCRMASERPDLLTIPYGVEYQHAAVLPSSPDNPFLRLKVPVSAGDGFVEIDTSLVGAYNADNVMAAIAVGKEFGVPLEDAAGAIRAYRPSNSRSQMVRTQSNVIVVDAYNANPTSMKAAIDNFRSMAADHKALMLGDMLELGQDSVNEHLAVLRDSSAMDADVYVVGGEFGKALDIFRNEHDGTGGDAAARPIMHFDTSDALAEWLGAHPLSGCAVLVKGSRGTRMEKILPCL